MQQRTAPTGATPTHGSSGWSRFDRLSLADLAHLRAERPGAPQHVGLVGVADRTYLTFAETFTDQLLSQRPDQHRNLADTLDRAWRVLATLPRRELTMLPAPLLDAHLGRDGNG